ncbi:calcium-binding protein [Pseudomonas subflava]|uniref:calcium-binding protein n=1 Tax=Pseudomonas subflava TaxID=2952933 RepID=UPI00207A193A|nr:calcium-binding protein [Pseudomonas subflava]
MADFSRVLVQGSNADDVLAARPEPSRLSGDYGNDVLIDSPGSDELNGGAGHNRLYGGAGNDYYVYEPTLGGRDEILDIDVLEPPGGGQLDTLIIGEGFESFGPLERSRDDLLIGINGEPGVVVVKYFFRDPVFRIERFRFGSTVVSDDQVMRSFHLDPTRAYAASDNFYYHTGDLVVLQSVWASRLVARDEATYLKGWRGDNILIGSRHGDVLDGGFSEYYHFGEISWNQLYGGPGDDIYKVQLEMYGKPVNNQIYDYDPAPGNVDTLYFQGAFDPSLMRFSKGPSDDLMVETGYGHRLVIINYFLDKSFKVEKIRFDDGTVLNETDVLQRMGLPVPVSPQASLSTPIPLSTLERLEPSSDGLLSLVLAAGAALTHSV